MASTKRQWFSGMLGVLLLVHLWVFAYVPAEDVLLTDDAYHYRFFADGRHDANYIEWWYFNVFDPQQEVQAIFTYAIADPQNRAGIGLAQVVAVAYTSQGVVSAVDGYSPDLFSASYEQADVRIGGNAIQVLDGQTYRIVGASRDGRLAWDLRYVRRAEPWFAGDRLAVGRLPWERVSWLVDMPGAEVSGQVVVDGQIYMINAPGYHDHNWGEWIVSDALWNWAQSFEPGLAFVLGDIVNQPEGVASVEFRGERTVFTKDQYHLKHTRWAFDAENGHWYPIQTTLRAENDTRRLLLRLQAIHTHPLRGDQPFPLPDVIVYEQTAHYEGELWGKNAEGEWVVLASLNGDGFKEYTTRSRTGSSVTRRAPL